MVNMFKREEIVGLLIGLVVVMLVTWLTLPTKQELAHNKECVEYCKKEIKRDNADAGIYSSYTYVRAISQCYEECIEEIDENSD
jgi:hypothetical protein